MTHSRAHHGAPLITEQTLLEGCLLARPDTLSYPIPGRLNGILVVSQISVAFAVLAAASHTTNMLGVGLLAVVCAFVMQLGFCLTREAVHGKLHEDRNARPGCAGVTGNPKVSDGTIPTSGLATTLARRKVAVK